MTEQREDFEEAASRLGYSLFLRDASLEDGEYMDPRTQGAWDMWQEPRAGRGECSMKYETWRSTFQSSEQAARAAYQELNSASKQNDHWAIVNPGHADQVRGEAMAARAALGFDRDSDEVSPADITRAINAIRVPAELGVPSLEWAVLKCKAMQNQGFDRVRLDVLQKDFQNALDSFRSTKPIEGAE